jgi:antitoxin ParD1/3/4
MPEAPMPATRVLHVELPSELAELVASKVERGEYASASEVVEEGLQLLQDRDEGLERWLREEVVQSYDQYRADPKSAVDADTIRERIGRLHRTRASEP